MQANTLPPLELYKISKFGEPYLYSVNRNTFENKSAKHVFESVFKERLSKEETLYVILGTDSGLLVDHILEQGLPYDSRFIFIDTPHVINTIEQQLSFTKWDERVSLCTLDNWQEAAENYKIQSYLFTEKIEYLKSVAAIDGFESSYYELDAAIALTMKSLQFKTLMSLSRAPFINGQLKNLSENQQPIINLRGKFDGQSCVILGGGPSLDESIDWLQENQHKIIIIAVSRIARKLLQLNIKPHIVISVDPHNVSYDVSKEMLLFDKDTIFFHTGYVISGLSAQWPGVHYYIGQRVPWGGKLSHENLELQGPTVTNSAISAALELGFKQILLSGVDMCFSKDGFTHAKGSNEADIGPMLGAKSQWIETYSGVKAETSPDFLHGSHILASQGEAAQDFDAKLYNLSLNAAKIDYIDYKAPEEVELTDSSEAEATLKTLLTEQAAFSSDNKQLIKEIDKMVKELNEVARIAKGALSDNAAMYKDYGNEVKNAQFKLKVDKAEKKLDSKFKTAALFTKVYGIRNFIKTVRTDTDEEWSDEQMEETGRLYYQSFIDTIDTLKPKLQDAKKRITARIEEDKANGNFKLFSTQWQEDLQYARAKLWQEKYPERYQALSEKQKQVIESCIDKFNQELENKETGHVLRTKHWSSLRGVSRKIVHLFQQNNQHGLTTLSENLAKQSQEKEEAKPLHLLAQAYLAILQKLPQQALSFFLAIDDSLLREDELSQISALQIQMRDYQDAEDTLKKLAEMADSFTPRYAKLLRLNKKVEQAVVIYESYLQNNAHDIASWLELGKLHLDQDAKTQARTAFESILAIDPNNTEANHYLAHC